MFNFKKSSMISPGDLRDLKDRLKDMVVTDIGATITDFKEALPAESSIYAKLLNLEGKYNDIDSKKIDQVISSEEEQITTNRIRTSLISLIVSLKEEDFVVPLVSEGNKKRIVWMLLAVLLLAVLGAGWYFINPLSDGAGTPTAPQNADIPAGKLGKLLYKIPNQMQVGQPTECVVRIAYDSVRILRDLVRTQVELRDIQTSDKMRVELAPTSGSQHAFDISYAVGKADQFIQTVNYTEWIFSVLPKSTGAHSLRIIVTTLRKNETTGEYETSPNAFTEEIEIITNAPTDTVIAFKEVEEAIYSSMSTARLSQVMIEQLEEQRNQTENLSQITELMDGGLTFNFPFNSARFSPDARKGAVLKLLVDRLGLTGEKVRITGHTDSSGSDSFNQSLGERRARAMADYLMALGLESKAIVMRSFGEAEPIATNETPEGRQRNRRVEVVLVR